MKPEEKLGELCYRTLKNTSNTRIWKWLEKIPLRTFGGNTDFEFLDSKTVGIKFCCFKAQVHGNGETVTLPFSGNEIPTYPSNRLLGHLTLLSSAHLAPPDAGHGSKFSLETRKTPERRCSIPIHPSISCSLKSLLVQKSSQGYIYSFQCLS